MHHLQRVIALAATALLAASLAGMPAIAAAAGPASDGTPASIVVAVTSGARLASVRSAVEKDGGTVTEQFRWNALQATVPASSDATAFAALVRAVPGVAYAQVNHLVHLMALPADDPEYTQQWGLPDIGAPAAWATSQGSGVDVAEIDTGIDASQPDLAGQVVLFRNYVTPGASASDDNGHGTHVAGIIAAIRNNGIEGVGTAPQATVYAFKALDANGEGYDDDIASAIRDAVDDTPCRIITMSLGGPSGGAAADEVLSSAVTYAESKGALVVAAAGNSATSSAFVPASLPGVIGVGAVDSSNHLASFSNYGSTDEKLVAPGVNIVSTVPGSTTQSWSGTSMATPFVTGAAALVWSAHPGLTAVQVAQVLENTAQDLGAKGVDATYGYGLVRPDLALASLASPSAPDTTPPTTVSDAQATYTGSATIRLTATDTGGSGVASTWYSLDGVRAVEGTTVSVSAVGAHSLTFWSVDAAGNSEQPHTVDFTITAAAPVPASIQPKATSLTLVLGHASVAVDHRVTLSGSLKPGTTTDIVRLYVERPGSSTYTCLTAMVARSSDGHSGIAWHYTFAPTRRGVWHVQARFLGTAREKRSTSPIRSLRVS